MKLYYSGTSPYVRKIHVALIETNLIEHVELAQVYVSPHDSGEFPLSANPLGKIPALERPDGATLYDSRVISRYLDDISGGALYPQKPRLWETLTLEATADGILDAAILMVYEDRARAKGKQDPKWTEAQWAKISRAIETIETRWMSHLHGPLDMAQIAVACALGYLDFRHADRDWRATHPGLTDWYENIARRPSFQETVPA